MLYDVLNETSSNVTSTFVTTEESIITTTRSVFDTSDVELPEERDEYLAKIEVATLASILLITLLGNGTVLLALWIRRRYGGRKKLSRMYFFILHLSCADLITAFFSVLPQLAWDITYRFYGGSLLCKLIKFGQTLGPYLSSYVLMATAIDRHQAICYPLTYCSWTSRRSKLMVWFAWISSLTFCIPQLLVFSYQEVEENVYDCWATFTKPWGDRAYVTWYSISIFIVPLLVLIVTYSCICREIWKSSMYELNVPNYQNRRDRNGLRRNPRRQRFKLSFMTTSTVAAPSSSSTASRYGCVSVEGETDVEEAEEPIANGSDRHPLRQKRMSSSANTINNKKNGAISSGSVGVGGGAVTCCNNSRTPLISRAKINTVKQTIAVIVMYVICSAPFIAAQLWATWDPYASNSSFANGPVFTIVTLLYSLNSCVNPWIYLAFNRELPRLLLRHYTTTERSSYRTGGGGNSPSNSSGLMETTLTVLRPPFVARWSSIRNNNQQQQQSTTRQYNNNIEQQWSQQREDQDDDIYQQLLYNNRLQQHHHHQQQEEQEQRRRRCYSNNNTNF